MSSHRSESVSIARSKSSHDTTTNKQEPGKKRKRNGEQASDVDSCISNLLKRVPEVDKHFDIIDILGDGTFSYVFHGKPRNVTVDTSFALKYIIPTSASWRITNEIKYLKRLGGVHHVCDIRCIIRHQDSIVLVLPYFSTTKFLRVVQDANQIEIQGYMGALFEALAHVHRHRVIHRDIKPSNFLYDREKGTFLLVDFGLAEDMATTEEKENVAAAAVRREGGGEGEGGGGGGSAQLAPRSRPTILRDRSPRVQQEKKKSLFGSLAKRAAAGLTHRSSSKQAARACSHSASEICNTCLLKPSQDASRAGTPGFRSPEMLMKHPQQTTSVDVWAAGVIMLSLVSMRYPFFKAADDLTSLCQIITLLGSDMLVAAGRAIGKQVTLSREVVGYDLRNMCERLRVSSHISRCQRCLEVGAPEDRSKVCNLQPIDKSVYDLLGRCLDPNPNTRITAEEALKHEFLVGPPPPPPLTRKF